MTRGECFVDVGDGFLCIQSYDMVNNQQSSSRLVGLILLDRPYSITITKGKRAVP